MKSLRHIVFLLAFTFCAVGSAAKQGLPAPSDPRAERALEMMNKMVAKFHAFLSKPQKLVYKQRTDAGATKSVYVLREVMTTEVSSEMKDTGASNVLFSGYLQFTFSSVADSVKCGAVELKLPGSKASASSGDALKFADKPECFAPAVSVAVPLVIHVNFAYQHGKWVPRSVTRSDDKRDPVLTATLLGAVLDDSEVVEDNDGAAFNSGWKALMTGNS